MNFQEIKDNLTQAIMNFITADRDLLLYDSHERAITHKLAEHMGGCFRDWNIDCEYDRIGKEKQQKLIHYSKEAFIEARKSGLIPDHIISYEQLLQSEYKTRVFPDIIVHKRGNINANLMVLEVKKANNTDVSLGWDQWKLQFFVHSLHYFTGTFVVFNTGIDSSKWEDLVASIEWFQ